MLLQDSFQKASKRNLKRQNGLINDSREGPYIINVTSAHYNSITAPTSASALDLRTLV